MAVGDTLQWLVLLWRDGHRREVLKKSIYMYGLFAGTKKVAIVEGWLFVEQCSALRKIEGCPAYDLYERSEIF